MHPNQLNVRPWHFRERFITPVPGDSRTQQSHADSTDINTIVNRYQRTGELPPNPRGIEGRFMDCEPLQKDLTTAYNDAKSATDRARSEYADHVSQSKSELDEGALPDSPDKKKSPAPSAKSDTPTTED